MARILVVDDDPDIRMVTALVLRRARHSVEAVQGGRLALTFFDEGGACDLILCDRMMPEMNGIMLLGEIRARPMPQPRFLFLSAKAQPDEVDEAMRAGADGYLVKPFEPKELLAAIERLCGRMGA